MVSTRFRLVLALGVWLFAAGAAQAQTAAQEAIVYLKQPVTAAQLQKLEARFGIDLEPNSASSGGRLFKFDVENKSRLQALLLEIETSPLVEDAEPNYVYKATGFPNDPLYSKQWNLKALGIERAWERADGTGAVVAVIDTGVAANLPDLDTTEFERGYDFVNDDGDATDDQGHGSHVAGTIAQSTDNGKGVAGIAYRARIMPIKVLDRYGSGTASDVADGIRLAADRGANVINLSLGGGGDSAVLRSAINYAHSKGVVIVCAAGNEGAAQSSYPALYTNCLSVSATGPGGSVAFYSNYGRGVDLSAPGGDKTENGSDGGVLQNTIDENGNSTYASYQGTSMAAPHVAGVAALLYSAGVHDPALIRKALLSTTRPVGDDYLSRHGTGQLNAALALESLENPYVFWRGGANWLLPLSTLLVGTLFALVVLIGGPGGSRSWFNETTYALGFVVVGLGFFPLSAVGTLWGPEGLLALLASPVANWDRVLLGGLLNPALHSVLVPLLLSLTLGVFGWGRSLAIGASIGTAALLTLQGTVFYGPLMWFVREDWARGFLLVNAALCLLLAFVAYRSGD